MAQRPLWSAWRGLVSLHAPRDTSGRIRRRITLE
jgi:hypothetical protein